MKENNATNKNNLAKINQPQSLFAKRADMMHRSSYVSWQSKPSQIFYKIDAIGNFAKFAENTCAGVSFYLHWRETPVQIISCEFDKISKHIFFIEHLQANTSGRAIKKLMSENLWNLMKKIRFIIASATI